MKNSGFTLVELLGTIVILSIIVIIITITVDTTISNSKKKLSKVQIANVEEAAEVYYLKEGIKNYSLDDESFEMCVNLEYLIDNDYIENEEIKNLKNSNKLEGSVKIKYESESFIYKYQENSCKIDYTVLSDNSNLTKLLSVATVSEELGVTSIDDCATSGICAPGTAFAIKVNDEETYKFYVISDNGGRITLMMDRNLGDSIIFAFSNIDEHLNNILNILEDRTSRWTNINSFDYSLNVDISDSNTLDFFKKTIKRDNARARLITYEEANKIITDNRGITPNFLYTNLEGNWICNSETRLCTDNSVNPVGYLLSTTSLYDSGTITLHFLINESRCGYDYNLGDNVLILDDYYDYYGEDIGIRPVIELSTVVRDRKLITDLELSETEIIAFPDVDYEVIPTIYPSNANNKNVVWSSNDASVVTVDQEGNITTHDFGSATITVKTTDGSNISKKITVRNPQYTNGILKSENDCINSGICTNGTMVNVQVNSSNNYNFYVIGDTGNELTMIMDRDIGSSAWSSSYVAANGPDTALSTLLSLTNDWTNITPFSYTLVDSNGYYSSKEINDVRSRLLTLKESQTLGCIINYRRSCPSYLYLNGGDYFGTDGHWISDSYQDDVWGYVIDSTLEFSAYWYDHKAGLRPVIKVSK